MVKKSKEELINIIKSRKFPQGFQRQEADGVYAIIVYSDLSVKGYDYAEGVSKLNDLDLVDLAYLVQNPMEDGEIKEIEEEIKCQEEHDKEKCEFCGSGEELREVKFDDKNRILCGMCHDKERFR